MAPFELNSPSLSRTQDSTTVYYETGQRDAWLPITVRVEMPLPPAVELPPKRDPLNCLLEDWFDWSTPNLMARFDRRYDVQHDLGRGGCGGVYLAHHRKLRLDFAVKFVPWALANPEGDHPTFNNDHDVVDPPEELVIMHYLRGHPNIIRAFEWYYDNDGYIIVRFRIQSTSHSASTICAVETPLLLRRRGTVTKVAHGLMLSKPTAWSMPIDGANPLAGVRYAKLEFPCASCVTWDFSPG